MSDLYEQIVSRRGAVERLMVRLPGFAGNMDKQARLAANRMLCDYVAAQVNERINRLTALEKKLLDKGGLDYMSQTNRAKTRMQLFRDRLKTAAPGHFGGARIQAEDFEKLYNFDEAQIRYVDGFDEALDKLADGVDLMVGIDEAVMELHQLAAEANESYARRENVLTHLSKSL